MTSLALLTHLAGEVLTTCTAIKIARRDGAVFGFTTLDVGFTADGVAYRAGSFSPSAVASSGDMSVANVDVQTLLDPDIITAADLLAGVWNYARVDFMLWNYADLTQGPRILRRGTLGEVRAGAVGFEVECRGLAQLLQQPVGEVSTACCRASLGDARCGVDLDAIAVTGAVTWASADGRTFEDPARTEPGPAGPITITSISNAAHAVVGAPGHGRVVGEVLMISGVSGMRITTWVSGRAVTGDASINGSFAVVRSVPNANALELSINTTGYSAYAGGGRLTIPGNVGTFDAGLVVWTSGDNVGRSMEVKAYAPGCIVLQSAMPYPIQIGDTYRAIPGCGKRKVEDCINRYNNVPRFRGESDRPGMDALFKAAGA